jgi:hypothetical protein
MLRKSTRQECFSILGFAGETNAAGETFPAGSRSVLGGEDAPNKSVCRVKIATRPQAEGPGAENSTKGYRVAIF